MTPSRLHAGRMQAPERRRQLLEAALEVFASKGFDGATTKEIAAAAGVTEAIIFRHFPTKLALYTAVLDQRTEAQEVQDWLALIKGYMEQNDDVGLFRTVASCILKSYREDARYERLLLFAALEGHELGLAHNRQFSLPIFQFLRDYVARRQREGAFCNFDPGLMIAAIGGMAQNYAMMTQMFALDIGNVSDEQVVDTFTGIFLNGIRP